MLGLWTQQDQGREKMEMFSAGTDTPAPDSNHLISQFVLLWLHLPSNNHGSWTVPSEGMSVPSLDLRWYYWNSKDGKTADRFAKCAHVSWLLLLYMLIHSLVGSLANLHGNPMCTIKLWIILFRRGSLGRLMRYYFSLIRCPDAEGHSHFPSCAQQQLVLSRVPSIAALWSVKLLNLWKGYLSA